MTDADYDEAYNEGYEDGKNSRNHKYDEGYDEGYKDGKAAGEGPDADEAVKMLANYPEQYSILETKTLDECFKAKLLQAAFEKMSWQELDKIFSRHQKKLFGYTVIQ